MNIMGIDIGTTSISMVLIDFKTRELSARKTVNHQTFLQGEFPDERIQDPERIWLLVKENLEELMAAYGRPSGIGLTGQMHGMLYVDGSGNAISPLYTWQDERADRPLEHGRSSVEYLKDKVGGVCAGYGLATHFYLQKTGQIPQNAEKMTTISDYIGMKLCGHAQPVIGADMAASWGCFDLEKREFLYDALEMAGVDISYLPELEKEHAIIGTTMGDIPVMVSIGDNQASVFGSVKSLSDTVLINVGTGSQVSFVTEKYVSCQGSLELRPCTKDSYMLAGSSLCGGRAYAMLERFFRKVSGNEEETYYPKMQEQAQKFIEEYGIEKAWNIRTTFSGTRSNPKEKGQMTDISEDNFHPGAMTAGVIMGILAELHEQYKKMCEITGKRADKLVGLRKWTASEPVDAKACGRNVWNEAGNPAMAGGGRLRRCVMLWLMV